MYKFFRKKKILRKKLYRFKFNRILRKLRKGLNSDLSIFKFKHRRLKFLKFYRSIRSKNKRLVGRSCFNLIKTKRFFSLDFFFFKPAFVPNKSYNFFTKRSKRSYLRIRYNIFNSLFSFVTAYEALSVLRFLNKPRTLYEILKFRKKKKIHQFYRIRKIKLIKGFKLRRSRYRKKLHYVFKISKYR